MLGLKLSDIESASIPKSAIATHSRFFIQSKMWRNQLYIKCINNIFPFLTPISLRFFLSPYVLVEIFTFSFD